MTDFTVTDAVIQHIARVATPHFKAINEDITEAYPKQPDMAYTLAIGFGVSVLLSSLGNPEERANAVNGINLLARFTGYALTPVT
jgi:hypothetical protein